MLGFGALGQFALGQGWNNAAAAGAIVTATSSAIDGTATGGAAVAGQILSRSATLIAGEATGFSAGEAPGALVVATVSVLPAIATGAATTSGADLAVDFSLLSGVASGAIGTIAGGAYPFFTDDQQRDGTAQGYYFVVEYIFEQGYARGEKNIGAVTPAADLGFNFVFIPGQAEGEATAQGAVFEVRHSISTDVLTLLDNDLLLTDAIDGADLDLDLLLAA